MQVCCFINRLMKMNVKCFNFSVSISSLTVLNSLFHNKVCLTTEKDFQVMDVAHTC